MTKIRTAIDVAITRGERDDLQRLIRQREKVLKSGARQRSAELLADFENQMGSKFSFDDDVIWAQAMCEAEVEIEKAKHKIAARCRELGIPDRFAPTLHMRLVPSWVRQFGGEASKPSCAAWRKRKIEAIERKAVTEIEMSCLRGADGDRGCRADIGRGARLYRAPSRHRDADAAPQLRRDRG